MNKEINEILDLTNKLLKIPSSISFEKPFLNYLEKECLTLGYNIIRDNKYLVIKPKLTQTKSKYLFSVHIDRHGLIKNENNQIEHLANYLKKKKGLLFKREEVDNYEKELINKLNKQIVDYDFSLDDVYLKIKDTNNIHSSKLNKFVRQGGQDFFEKIGIRHTKEDITSYNLETGKKYNNYKTTRYNLDIKEKLVTYNLNSKPNVEDNIFMLNSQIDIFEDKFSGQIDNVISVAVLLYLLKNTEFSQQIIFTTCEEIGDSYNCVIDYFNNYLLNEENKLNLVILDTSPYPDFKKFKEGFVTLRYGDENGGFDKKLVEKIKVVLETKNIPFDFKPSYLGRTELGRVSSESLGKINGTTFQLPTLNYHTTYETGSIKSLENYVLLIKDLIK